MNREKLAQKEFERIKNSGVVFKGQEGWPVFSNYTSGYVPERATSGDEKILQAVGEFLLMESNFAKKLRIDEENMTDSQLPFYRIDSTDRIEPRVYSLPEEWMNVSVSKTKELAPVCLSLFELERAKRLPIGTFLWEIDTQYVNQPMVAEGESRAAFPLLFLIGDPVKMKVLETEVLFQRDIEQIQRTLVQQMISENIRPPQIALETRQMKKLFPMIKNLLEELQIDLLIIDVLPYLSIIKENLRNKLDEQTEEEE